MAIRPGRLMRRSTFLEERITVFMSCLMGESTVCSSFSYPLARLYSTPARDSSQLLYCMLWPSCIMSSLASWAPAYVLQDPLGATLLSGDRGERGSH